MLNFIIQASYFASAVLFIYGLKQMSSPVNARKGIVWAGIGMVIATVVTFFHPDIHGTDNYVLIALGIGIGGYLAWTTGKNVAMTDMPQMVALYNGMGGGAAAAIAGVELIKQGEMTLAVQILAVLGALIGTVAFSGSIVAYAKLQGIMRKTIRFPNQQWVNAGVFILIVLLGLSIAFGGSGYGMFTLFIFFVLSKKKLIYVF